ncbi:hypothetical protein AB0H51_28000 [Streptomyces griseoluteus]|uniref:hypothetical protein n=1 Tax=Streptomyces griseoluteus TaxID=29306 RepID=UPI0033E5A844
MHNHYRRPRFQPIALAGVAALAVFLIVLFAVVQGDDDDPPRCPVSHSGAVDLVPSGVRPCLLYGSGTGVATGYGHGYQHSGTSHTGSTPRPRSTVKAPGAPKAPAVKAPAAPKPAAPAAPKMLSPRRR